jgi:hypothetical protein
MKRIRSANILVIVALLLLSVSTVSAAGPTGSWVTGITCQNLNTTTQALVTFQFYQEGSSTPALTYADTIPAGGTVKYYTPNTPSGLPAPFSGSLTVSSDQPVTCNANLQSTGTGTAAAPYRYGTASALDSTQAGTTMYVPQITKASGWNTYIAVQNAGSASETFTVHYYDKNTGLEVPSSAETYTIDPNSSKVVYPELNTHLPTTWYGGATITGTQPKAVIVSFYNSGISSTTAQFQVYDAFASGSNKLLLPRMVRRYYGYNSGVTIQNISNVTTTVTINFTFKGGSTYTYTSGNILPKASLILYATNIAALNPVDLLPMQNRTGSATVVANAAGAQIVGIVNMDNRGDPNDNNLLPVPAENIGKGGSSNMGVYGQETFKVFFSQVPRNAGNLFTGGVVVANTAATAGTCQFAFTGVAAATKGVPNADASGNVVLPANGQISFFLGNVVGLPDGFNASVTATCTQKVFGVSNWSVNSGTGKLGDSYVENNGYNQ